MQQSRRHRFIATLLALISVLFTQLAVAAYVCPSMQIGQAMKAIAASGAKVDHHAMAECEGMDSEQPVLCQDHGQVSHQSLDKLALPDVAPFIATTQVPAVGFADPFDPAVPSQGVSLSLTRTTAPPLSIRNCCFRI